MKYSVKSYIMKPDIGAKIKKQPITRIKRHKSDYNKSKKPLSIIGGFSKSKKGGYFDIKKDIDTPSPWTYNPKETYRIGEKNKGFTIKSKEKLNLSEIKNDTPGPGYYELDNE